MSPCRENCRERPALQCTVHPLCAVAAGQRLFISATAPELSRPGAGLSNKFTRNNLGHYYCSCKISAGQFFSVKPYIFLRKINKLNVKEFLMLSIHDRPKSLATAPAKQSRLMLELRIVTSASVSMQCSIWNGHCTYLYSVQCTRFKICIV